MIKISVIKLMMRIIGGMFILSLILSLIMIQFATLIVMISEGVCKNDSNAMAMFFGNCPSQAESVDNAKNIMSLLLIGPALFFLSYILVLVLSAYILYRLYNNYYDEKIRKRFFSGLIVSLIVFFVILIKMYLFSDVITQEKGLKICPTCPELPLKISLGAELYTYLIMLIISWFAGYFSLWICIIDIDKFENNQKEKKIK